MSGDFKTEFETENQIFIEGTHRGLPNDTELLEFRMDGPQRRQAHRGQFVLYVEINILVRSFMDDEDFHKMRRLIGEVATWLGRDRCIYRYGDGSDDDESLLGTLTLKNRKPYENIRVNQFGQIDPQYRIEQATVEASFELCVTEPEPPRGVLNKSAMTTCIFSDEVDFEHT
jgi:hypothetical protein